MKRGTASRSRSEVVRSAAKKLDRPVVLNKPVPGIDPTGYARATSPHLEKLIDEVVSKGCVSDSLYKLTRPLKDKNGWNLRILPKGTKFYKAFPGFVTHDQMRAYGESNGASPSWYGNAAIALAFSSVYWGGIVAFEATRDLRLVDWFDEGNMARIIGILRKIGMEREVDALKVNTGFRIDLAEQMTKLSRMHGDVWEEYLMYTRAVNPAFNTTSCDVNEARNFNPLVVTKTSFVIDKKWWQNIIPKMIGIDGVIKKSVLSSLEETGAMYEEEMIISSGLYGEAFAQDLSDPYHWKRWKIKSMSGTKYAGIVARVRINRITEPKEHANDNFALIKHIAKARGAGPAATKMKGIVSYNVANLYPPDAEKDTADAIEWLSASLKGCFRAEAVALQEVPLRRLNTVVEMLKRRGYKSISHGVNGSADMAVCLAVRDAGVRFEVVQVRKRNHIVASNGICALHLDIGTRRVKGNEEANAQINENNSKLRISVLQELLEHRPRVLVGDFNFAASDPEDQYLRDRGYVRLTPAAPKTTPHNRVDHVYYRSDKKPAGSKSLTFPSPVSDHALVFQQTTGLV